MPHATPYVLDTYHRDHKLLFFLFRIRSLVSPVMDTGPCGTLQRRTLTVTDCPEHDHEDCLRAYHLYIPAYLCSGDANGDADAAPLVVAAHCFGCPIHSMLPFMTLLADQFRFVLVLPEGIQGSFNGKYCCGYAQKRGIDDVGFIEAVVADLMRTAPCSSLTEGLPEGVMLSPGAAYGVGWSNGGYLVTLAGNRIFRAVVPISGSVYDVGQDVGRMMEGGAGVGLLLHHSLDDPYVRFTGCCSDPAKPKCCCGISTRDGAPDTCTNSDGVFEAWADEVNGCAGGGYAPSLESAENGGISCRTAIGEGCRANTTICVHHTAGHFNEGGGLGQSFPRSMLEEVGHFFAQDACGIHGGEWSKGGKDCECVEGGNGWDGRYCLRPPGNDTMTSSSCSVGYVKDSNWLAFFVVVCIAIAVTLQRRKRLIPREKREDEIEMEPMMERKR